ncbi:DUF2947 domain-containing protein, partial [Pseudoalteromonas sp. S1612]
MIFICLDDYKKAWEFRDNDIPVSDIVAANIT